MARTWMDMLPVTAIGSDGSITMALQMGVGGTRALAHL